jgi:hypothetical protein
MNRRIRATLCNRIANSKNSVLHMSQMSQMYKLQLCVYILKLNNSKIKSTTCRIEEDALLRT